MNSKKLNYLIIVLVIFMFASVGLTAFFINENRKSHLQYEALGEEMQTTSDDAAFRAICDAENKTYAQNADYKTAIANKIIARDVVESAYFSHIDDVALIEKIEMYNNVTSIYRPNFEDKTMNALNDCFNLAISSAGYHKQPVEIRYIIEKIGTYAMYKNAVELVYSDFELAQMLCMEPFKSNKEWMNFINNEAIFVSTDVYELGGEDYFDLVDGIIKTLGLDTTVIADKVINREVIEDTYFCMVTNTELLQNIKTYNELTAKYRFSFSNHQLSYDLSYIDTTNGLGYFDRTSEMVLSAAKVSKYALYRNVDQLIYNDPFFSAPLVDERAGSGGQWPRFIHSEPQTEDAEKLAAYFDLADSLVTALK